MKSLIVNADDLGAASGVNRGILEAHRRGVVTSASLLVGTPWSADAAGMARDAPGLSVGLHVDLDRLLLSPANGTSRTIGEALEAQYSRFEQLMGRPPTHLDSHHNVHRNPHALPHFLELASVRGLPLREHGPARYFPDFYGQWDGKSHEDQVSPESLIHMLEAEIGEGLTELSCHPGHTDAGLTSSYASEREAELRTLCDPLVPRALKAQGIHLVNYHDLRHLHGGTRS